MKFNFVRGKKKCYIFDSLYKQPIDVFGPLPATMGDTPNRPKMTTKN